MNSKRTLMISILAVFIILAAALPFSQIATSTQLFPAVGISKVRNSAINTSAKKIVVEVYPGSNQRPDQNWEHVWGDQALAGKPVVDNKQDLGWDHIQGEPTSAGNGFGWSQISGK